KLTHEFVIGDAVLQAEHDKEMQAMPGMEMHDVNGVALPPGRTRDLVWTFTRDGTVEYACHIPGHFAAGMVGKIIIESAKHG
ncbi:MAG TPA: plastocyanin/azurin family copper-binding protein, partial [Gammaproteobacteria bacterium]|nr:plastocyanin/azurin family copper-binding protein [Gammaproteobacteria bacterium]